MHKRALAIFLVAVFMLSCAGCSGAWRRKIVRKKTAGVKEEPVLSPVDYSKEFTNQQLYANHFSFWRASESELISCLSGRRNNRKVETYASYSVDELMRLHVLLVEPTQKELEPFIEELKEIIPKLSQPDYVDSHRNLLLGTLEKHHRNVSKKFSYYNMRGYIRPDEKSQPPEKPKNTEVVEAGKPPEPVAAVSPQPQGNASAKEKNSPEAIRGKIE